MKVQENSRSAIRGKERKLIEAIGWMKDIGETTREKGKRKKTEGIGQGRRRKRAEESE